MVATDGLSTTGRSLLFGMQRYEWVSGLSLLFHIGKTVLVGLLWWSRQGLVSLAVGLSALAVAQAVMFSVAAWVLSHRAAAEAEPAPPVAPGGEPPLLRQMFGYCMPLLGARAAFLSGQNLGKVVLAKVLDATQLGYFTFAFQTIERFVELVYTLPSSLLPSLTHLVARDERERLGYVFEQAFRLVKVAACVVAWGVFAFAPELTLWVGSPLFLPSLGMLQVLALVPLARTAQQPLTMLFQAMRRPGTVLALALIKLGVELGCYFVIVPRLGGLGAAYANLAGAVASYLMALVYAGVLLPEGAGARTAAVVRALLLTLPMLAVSWVLSQQVHPEIVSFLARAVLILPAIVALFALGLITRYDLEKLSALELRAPAVRRLRDLVVGVADRLARVFEPRRTA
jgi:O-antigen/teichoic acid export membrane protein